MSGIGEALLISAAASLLTAGITYALTPTQKIDANRLNDLTSGTSSYGSPLPWAWGTVRLPGNKIWLDYLEETRRKEKQGKVETTFFDYYGYYASMYCECPFRPIVDYNRIWMNKKLVYSQVGGEETIAAGGKFAEQYLRFYKGEPAQNIDPLLANKDPISNYSYGLPTDPDERDTFLRAQGIDPNTAILTPTYNYRGYMVAQRIPLADFFNALPRDEAEIVASTDCTVGQIVGDIFSLYYPPERYDVSLLTTSVKGFSVDTVEAAKLAIQTLQQAYFFDIVNSNGVYKFIPLNHPRDVVNLRASDLAAYTGTQKPLDYEIVETDPSTLPSEVIVKYIDPDLNYDVNEQRSQLEVKGHYNPNPVTLSFNLVLSASDAATIADRALILAWVQKYTYSFKLPPAYLTLEPTDLVPNLFDDRAVPIKLTQTRLGANLIVECEGTAHDIFFWNLVRTIESGDITLGVADYNVTIVTSGRALAVGDGKGNTYTEGVDYTVNNEGIQVLNGGNIPQGTELIVTTAAKATVAPSSAGEIVSAGDTELLVLDIPLIRNSDEDYTLYLAASGGENWNGASIYLSTDNARYLYATNISDHSVYGTTDTDLVDGNITVTVNRSELESITDSDLELGLNLALIGDEIIQFKTAQLTGVNQYILSDLIRGLRGTETQPIPVAGDRFVLLTGDSAEIVDITLQATDIGEVKYFKAVSRGQTPAEVDAIQITHQGIAQRPYAPVNLRATKNGVGDIFITWDRRDRHSDIENPPILSEDEEKYVINFLAAAFEWEASHSKRALTNSGELIRTKQTNNNSSIYLASEQTSDFGSVVSTITVKIAQVSSVFDNGSFAVATLTPAVAEPNPTIESVTPASGLVGDTVTISGTDLAQVQEIKIGDILQNNLAVIDNTTVEFVITTGTVSGRIELTTPGGKAYSSNALIIESAQTLEGHVIQDDGGGYHQRTNLKFTGNVAITDDETEDVTIVEVLSPTQTAGEITYTTLELADGEFEAIDLELPAITALRQIDVSQPSRIRLFGTDAARASDTADINTQLQDASGLILDKLVTDSYQFARGLIAQNCDDPITNYIYARIFNNSGSSNSIDVGIKYYAIALGTSEEGNDGQISFAPTDIPGLKLWLDATDSNTLTLSSTGVTRWADKSGNGNDAVLFTGLPQLGDNAIVFDGDDGFKLEQPRFSGNSPRSIFVSIKIDPNQLANAVYAWMFGNFTTNQMFALKFFVSIAQVNIDAFGSTNVVGGSNSFTDFGNWVIMEANIDNGTASLLKNNAVLATNQSTYNTNDSYHTLIGGARQTTSSSDFQRGMTGQMNQMIIYDRALAHGERTQVYGYMTSKLP